MTADRHMQEASSVIDKWDEQKADLFELHSLIATALAAAEKRGREEEREACAKMAEDRAAYYAASAYISFAAAIRARKDQDQ